MLVLQDERNLKAEPTVGQRQVGRTFFGGTPLVWQSMHLTVWTLWGLFVDLKVVSIFSTSRPQFESWG